MRNKDTVFQNILKPISRKLIQDCIERYQSDYRYEKLNTFEHLKTMIYAQINEIKSLRTLEIAINSQKIGIQTKIKRSTLSDANKKRPAESFFYVLKQLICMLPRKKHAEMKKVIRILDSSPIQLRGDDYDRWTKQHATRHIQGLKLHIEYDLALNSPVKAVTSPANVSDVSMGKGWPIITDTVYVFDKGYYDYNWWWSINQKQAYFVTRLKKNAAIITEKDKKVANGEILRDCHFRISKKVPRGGKQMEYRDTLRLVRVKREDKHSLVLVTNLKDMPAKKIADLYKARWEIELFFKWIKQNLRIKKFLGRSENAIQIQIASALIAYLLIQLFKMQSGNPLSLRLTLTWVRHNLSAKRARRNKLRPPTCPPSGFSQNRGVYL